MSAEKKGTSKEKKSAATEKIVFDVFADRTTVAEQALANQSILTTLIGNLSIEARRVRQFSASAIGAVAEICPQALTAYTPQIIDALHRPEAQTRWESLEVLTHLVVLDTAACDEALLGAEISLYDEESGNARLAAMRFLCAYGAADAERSDKVWSMVDEAIQCYHGDLEFQDMLIAVISFAGGAISRNVKKALAERMDFDAKNAKGVLKRRAEQIVELCKKK